MTRAFRAERRVDRVARVIFVDIDEVPFRLNEIEGRRKHRA